jgi:DNA-binding protein YbaB
VRHPVAGSEQVGGTCDHMNIREDTLSAEFDQLVAQFEQFQSKMKNLDDQFGSVAEMQSELSELEAAVTSPDRSITVTAGPGGSVKDIKLTEAALKQRPEALAGLLMSMLQQAVAESARKQAGIVDQHMGGQLNVTDQVLQTQAEALGTTVEDLRSKMADATSPPRPAAEEHHDDYSEQSFLQQDKPGTTAPPPPAAGGSQADDFLKNLFNDDEDRR